MSEKNSRNNRQVSIPNFRNETERSYQYSKRPYQKDYLKGTEWDREEKEERPVRKRETTPIKKRPASKTQTKQVRKKRKKQAKRPVAQATKRTRGRKQRKFVVRRFVFAMLCMLSILIGGFAGRVQAQLNHVLDQKKTSMDLQEVTVDESNLLSDTDVVNILIVGADKRESWSESGRSDCVMIGTIDKKHKRLKLTSLMRDMYVDIPNHGKSKFNAAYSYGGISLLYQTIAYNFDMELDGYVLVDFAAFKKVVNKIGGVDVTLTDAEASYLQKAYHRHPKVACVKAGEQTLTGAQALAYVRIRQDVRADFGRTERQRTVIQAIFKKAKTKSYSQLVDLAKIAMPCITTDLTNEEIFACLSDVITMGTTTIDQKRIPIDGSFESQRINNQAVLVPNLDVNKEELQEFVFEYAGEEEENKTSEEKN